MTLTLLDIIVIVIVCLAIDALYTWLFELYQNRKVANKVGEHEDPFGPSIRKRVEAGETTLTEAWEEMKAEVIGKHRGRRSLVRW